MLFQCVCATGRCGLVGCYILHTFDLFYLPVFCISFRSSECTNHSIINLSWPHCHQPLIASLTSRVHQPLQYQSNEAMPPHIYFGWGPRPAASFGASVAGKLVSFWPPTVPAGLGGRFLHDSLGLHLLPVRVGCVDGYYDDFCSNASGTPVLGVMMESGMPQTGTMGRLPWPQFSNKHFIYNY